MLTLATKIIIQPKNSLSNLKNYVLESSREELLSVNYDSWKDLHSTDDENLTGRTSTALDIRCYVSREKGSCRSKLFPRNES